MNKVFVLAQMVEPQPYSNDDFPPYPSMSDAVAFMSRDGAVEHLKAHASCMTEWLITRSNVGQYEVMEVNDNTFHVGIRPSLTTAGNMTEYKLYEVALAP